MPLPYSKPYFSGVKNVHTDQRHVIDWSSCLDDGGFFDPMMSGLPCGVYQKWMRKINCKECDGTGEEEVSGGHKKECKKCFGSGLDPVLLDQFEKDQLHYCMSWPIHKRTTTHIPSCLCNRYCSFTSDCRCTSCQSKKEANEY